MKYVSVGCVVGIIAGFCIGPGGLHYIHIFNMFQIANNKCHTVIMLNGAPSLNMKRYGL